MRYSISARKKLEEHIKHLVNHVYSKFEIQINEIANFYGFREFCPLYGGKPFVGQEISDDDLTYMYDNNIGLRLPLTNLFVTYDEYKSQKAFLEKYHREGNSIITVSDKLAKWIRTDFPKYRLEASIVKRIRTFDALNRALELYDNVLPDCSIYGFSMDDLSKIEQKDRIILFENLGCENYCKSQKCYPDISMQNKSEFCEKIFPCYRPEREFDPKTSPYTKEALVKLGFNHFKLVFGNPLLRGKYTYYPHPIYPITKD